MMSATGDNHQIPEAAQCRGCGYSLRGLPEFRCPECGLAFDPTDPRTMRRSPFVIRAIRIVQSWFNIPPPIEWVIAALIATLLILLMDWEQWGWSWTDELRGATSFDVGWILWAAITAKALRSSLSIRSLWLRLATISLAPMLLLIPLSFSLCFDSCPHATYMMFGANMWVTSGDWCGNPRTRHTIWSSLFDRLGWIDWHNVQAASALGLFCLLLPSIAGLVFILRRYRMRAVK
jgi:hypothetical protein